MGGTVEFSPVINVSRIDALGCYAETLSIFAHTLPPSAGIDGVLGLDFFRRRRLIIDFTTGEIEVT